MRRRSSLPSGNSPENDEEKGKGAVGGGRRRVGFTDLGEWKYVFRGLGFLGVAIIRVRMRVIGHYRVGLGAW